MAGRFCSWLFCAQDQPGAVRQGSQIQVSEAASWKVDRVTGYCY
jgi:hypothetical protein